MGYIYKITNDINDKVYVGKTLLPSIEERFQAHIKDSKRRKKENRPLYKAMNKYGSDKFHIELIGEYPEEELNEMEVYWIGYYHGYTDGYNATKGGDGKTYLDRDAILERLKEFPYPLQVANEFGCSSDSVRIIAKANNIEVRNYQVDLLKKTLYCIDKKTDKIIKSFDSVHDAILWCNKNGYSKTKDSTHIAATCRGDRKSAYGFKWRYADDLDKS